MRQKEIYVCLKSFQLTLPKEEWNFIFICIHCVFVVYSSLEFRYAALQHPFLTLFYSIL